jgi:hypothetical protein
MCQIAAADGQRLEVTYEPSMQPGELVYGVTYALWLPPGVEKYRGILVHQHGCGTGACKGGETAADDLHWQALARKWDCALLGPSYHQVDGQDCRAWCDPRRGSRTTFLRSLEHFAKESGHPELAAVPWCLWGHSGGGFWSSLMQASDPERIIAIWCRSGTAYETWEKGEIPKPELGEAVYQVPVMCNPGAKENGDKRFNGAWTGAMAMFEAYRAHGAPIGLAPDPRTSHECGDSRYLAIPFFDACLAMRLPEKGSASQKLKPVDESQACLAEPLSHVAAPAREFQGDASKSVWLPNAKFAAAWTEYVQTGAVPDETPPPAPRSVAATKSGDQFTVSWDAPADFESGVQAFLILRNGEQIAQVPEKPAGRFGRALFQTMSYHDTPERPLPEQKFIDPAPGSAAPADYAVVTVNSAGLKSPAVKAK